MRAKHLIDPAQKITWFPTFENPYLPAYHLHTHTLAYQPQGHNTPTPVILKKGESPEHDAIAIRPTFHATFPQTAQTDQTDLPSNIIAGIEKINQEIDLTNSDNHGADEGSKLGLSATFHGIEIQSLSIKEALHAGDLFRRIAPEHTPDVYRIYCKTWEVLPLALDQSAIIESLASYRTYLKLKARLADRFSIPSIELFSIVNKRMTALINRILSQNLSLPIYQIEHFQIDIDETLSVIENDLGKPYLDAFLRHQNDLIRSEFILMDSDLVEEYSIKILGKYKWDSVNKPKLTFLGNDLTVTYLNCLSQELRLQLPIEYGALITKEWTPSLYLLLDGLFRDIDAKGRPFSRNLIVTKDRKILEAVRGHIGTDAFILTLTGR